jgi:ribosomal protein S11
MTPGAQQPAGGVWESEGGFPNYAIFYVLVQDIAATVERAEKLGAEVLMTPVSDCFQAVRTGDMVTLGELLDEAIVWHQPGANQFSGERKGRDAVFAMLGRMMEASQGTFAIDSVHTLMANGDLVAATIHFSGRRDNASMSM